MRMTARQQRFVQEYLIDLNATAAYRRAGYKASSDTVARVEGCRLLANPSVAAAIQVAQAERAERTRIDQELVVAGLLEEARRMGKGASHGARVTAWTQLGRHLGTFTDKVQAEPGNKMREILDLIAKNPIGPPSVIGEPRRG